MRSGSLLACFALAACTSTPEPSPRRERLARIRDAAAEMGVHNAALLGGIAVSETNLAHCWSEATYACQGPISPSCNGPVIAGSADGPCADMAGGLGMFQFDAGTWSETLATYGDAILSEAGNTAQAVSFVVAKIEQDIPDAGTWTAATAWLDRVPLIAGEALTETWAERMACRYNGCCSGSATCQQRAAGYRDHAIALVDELGAAFWDTSTRCAALPSDGAIAPRSACYLAAGDPRTWRATATGETAIALAEDAPAAADRFARWQLRVRGRYALTVHATGGTATAIYRVVHAGAIERVVVDQATTDTAALGDFDLTGDDYVELGLASPTPGATLAFGTLRATRVP